MATKTLRIDASIQDPNGAVRIQYTEGLTPLPDAPAGMEMQFESVQAMALWLEQMQSTINSEVLLAFALGAYAKGDPNMDNVSLAKNKTASVDLLGATALIVVK